MDVMAAVRQRKAKAESRIARAEKMLESAKKQLTDILAAERVLADITGESPEPKVGDGSVSPRDVEIARLIPCSPDAPLSPAELYPLYLAQTKDNINLEAFRTAVWRLLKKTISGDTKSWVVKSDAGKYWREPVGSAEAAWDDATNEFEVPGDQDDPFA